MLVTGTKCQLQIPHPGGDYNTTLTSFSCLSKLSFSVVVRKTCLPSPYVQFASLFICLCLGFLWNFSPFLFAILAIKFHPQIPKLTPSGTSLIVMNLVFPYPLAIQFIPKEIPTYKKVVFQPPPFFFEAERKGKKVNVNHRIVPILV